MVKVGQRKHLANEKCSQMFLGFQIFCTRVQGVHVPLFTTSHISPSWDIKVFFRNQHRRKRKSCFCVTLIWIDRIFLPSEKDEMTNYSASKLWLFLIVFGSRLLLINPYDIWQLLVSFFIHQKNQIMYQLAANASYILF